MTGVVTVTAVAPVTIGELTVTVFPVGARRLGVDEASVRTREFTIWISQGLGANLGEEYRFTWDQQTDGGTQAATGSYVFSIRMTATMDEGDDHAAMTIAANEPVVEVR